MKFKIVDHKLSMYSFISKQGVPAQHFYIIRAISWEDASGVSPFKL